MGLLRPLTRDFTDDREVVIAKHRQKHVLSRTVEPGKPFAQVYGFGVQWSRLDLELIAGAGTPASKVNHDDGFLYYPVGPPYLGTVADMHKIATKWSEFVPKVYEQYPYVHEMQNDASPFLSLVLIVCLFPVVAHPYPKTVIC